MTATSRTAGTGVVEGPPRRSGWDLAARVFTGVAVLLTVAMPILGMTRNAVLFAAIPVSAVIAGRRYGWRVAGLYLAVTFLVANVFENLSINTGFPFGTYHYPGSSLRIVDFPVIVAVTYCSLGMICWLIAAALLDNADLRLGDRTAAGWRVNVVALPVLAAALMTMFDLGIDSAASTIQQTWIWENGGGVFGVPWTNYLGWWFVTYVFFQIFALVLTRRRPSDLPTGGERREPLALALIVYFMIVAVTMIQFFTVDAATVTDAAGQVWNTDDIYATLFSFNLFGPVVLVVLAAVKLARGDADRRR
ncbi:carotenoid biosynthesis protein [Actinoplanes sp. LDG1-06]|uniref:Carotenoid biosynthesis protein n=1 Tax=Paractinoplanes ovalisporus TaxID=2810368 RepID=A0ABS2AM59_9ACTN|nr:carotenoid biosynthesis protein [Actinoplanes ovalisporus]MBM2620468.1 carotenoid biosynthesis protein [Actinoplanes ovalisporus]